MISLLAVHREDYKLMLTRLREARNQAGLSQRAVAARIGKPQSYIHKWECGQRQLNLVDLRDLCSALDISFVEFIKSWDDELKRDA